jgi:hypothetical protein
MTAATVTTRFEGAKAHEYVNLTVTDGETFVSKLGTPEQAYATAQEDDDGEINCTISGRTITINAAGMTDVLIALHVVGKL